MEVQGSTREVQRSTVELQGSILEYSGSTGEYKGSTGENKGSTGKYNGATGKHSGSILEYRDVQWNYVLKESRFLLLESNPSQGPLAYIYLLKIFLIFRIFRSIKIELIMFPML